MSVEFNEAPSMVRTEKARYSFPTKLVMKAGLAKTPEAAAVILLVIAIAAAVLALFFFVRLGSPPPPPTPAELGL